MPYPTALPAFSRARHTPDHQTDYCTNCDTLLGTPGLHILTAAEAADHIDLIVETTSRDLYCPACGTRAVVHGRTTVELVDAPCFEFPVVLHWRKRRLACPDRHCRVSTFSEADRIADIVAPPRCRLTCRAVFWAIERLRRDHASVNALTRQLSVNWHTIWDPVSAVLEYFDDNDNRYNGVTEIGGDEHIWHHRQPKTRGPERDHGDGRHHPRQSGETVDPPAGPDARQIRACICPAVSTSVALASPLRWTSPPWTRSRASVPPSMRSTRVLRWSWNTSTW